MGEVSAELQAKYDAAVNMITNGKPKEDKATTADKLKLYGNFKQVKERRHKHPQDFRRKIDGMGCRPISFLVQIWWNAHIMFFSSQKMIPTNRAK